eukprot:TRINITY_DN1374_c0_g2_i10.p1 TRINITY_DN1374_c0_g2~~TRINITY_DN1374_c0_g2_i10.p1  ORF type:complete len:245 (-),score=50.19 TRINITY_DN1374_c0_g2_i10:1035-1769(-)
MMGTGLFTLGALVISLSPYPWKSVIMVGRLVVGLAMGLASSTVPLYIAELSPAAIRGTLVSCNEILIVFGIFLSFLVNSLLSYSIYGIRNDFNQSSLTNSSIHNLNITSDTFNTLNITLNTTFDTNKIFTVENAWRWSFGVSAIPAVVQFFGLVMLPESPRWLIYKGKVEEGFKVLCKLRPSLYLALQERDEILLSMKYNLHSAITPTDGARGGDCGPSDDEGGDDGNDAQRIHFNGLVSNCWL